MFQLFDFLNKKFHPIMFKSKADAINQIMLMNILQNKKLTRSANKEIFIETKRGQLIGKIGIVKHSVAN